MNSTSNRVNFLFLGGDKCGSTWLDFILRQHPDVCLANTKELFFFDRYHDRGLAWYDRQFPTNTTALRTGEICHDYLYSEAALKRIGKALPPDARCLICLRHPVDRTLSHYRYLLKIGTTTAPFDQALHDHPGLLSHSLYAHRIEQAFTHIGRHRVHVLFYDDLARDPAGFGQQISNALGIRTLPELPYQTRVLGAARSRAPKLTRVLRNTGWGLRRLGAQRLVGVIKSNATLQRLLFTADDNAAQHPDRHALLPHMQQFSDDHARLKQLLDKVPNWKME